jgi:hypothetical protein
VKVRGGIIARQSRRRRGGARGSGNDANGGAGGIRTLDRPLQAYNGLANRRLQPLGHSSIARICLTRGPAASGRFRLRRGHLRALPLCTHFRKRRASRGARLGCIFRALWSADRRVPGIDRPDPRPGHCRDFGVLASHDARRSREIDSMSLRARFAPAQTMVPGEGVGLAALYLAALYKGVSIKASPSRAPSGLAIFAPFGRLSGLRHPEAPHQP